MTKLLCRLKWNVLIQMTNPRRMKRTNRNNRFGKLVLLACLHKHNIMRLLQVEFDSQKMPIQMYCMKYSRTSKQGTHWGQEVVNVLKVWGE